MPSPVDDSLVGLDPEVDAFIRALLDRAAAIRLPELFQSRHPEALYWVGDRHGVSTVALRTTSLTAEQLVAIMTFRLAQYLMAHQLDPRLIYEKRLAHEPLENVSERDVHVISGAAATGTMLAYVTLERYRGSTQHAMGEVDRALFPVETVFGVGVFNRLSIVRDLPVHRVCELGRFMKNHFVAPLDEAGVRGTVELVLGVFRTASQQLRSEVDIGVGDIEESVAKKNFDFFEVPITLVRGVVPFVPERSFGFFNYQHRNRYPFAMLFSDIPSARLDRIENALQLGGREALLELGHLKKSAIAGPSSLSPEGLPALDNMPVPQAALPMAVRRELLDVGEWLRSTTLFRDLSVAEAAVLSTFLQRLVVEPDTMIIRQGEAGDDVFLIEQGTADVFITAPDGRRIPIRTMGPRDYFGEIALLSDGRRTADVVASSLLVLLRLSRADYERYLARMIEVEHDLTKTALARSRDTMRAHESKPS